MQESRTSDPQFTDKSHFPNVICKKNFQLSPAPTEAISPTKEHLQDKFKEASKKRLLKAYLDIAIMAEMAERDAMSAPHIISYIKSKFDVSLSPGTVYPVLRRMERTGDIRLLPKRRIKFYFITKNGLEKLSAFQKSIEKTEDLIPSLFKLHTLV